MDQRVAEGMELELGKKCDPRWRKPSVGPQGTRHSPCKRSRDTILVYVCFLLEAHGGLAVKFMLAV